MKNNQTKSRARHSAQAKELVRMSNEEMPDDFPELSEAELDEYLRSLGLDPVELVQRMRVRIQKIIDESPLNPKNQSAEIVEIEQDLSFTAHDDATSQGCQMCGNEWKSLNKQGYCSNCWTVWNS